MFTQLVARSEDLRRLVNDGYALSLEADRLVVSHVPYLDNAGAVQYGSLICELTTDGGATVRPSDHTMHFTGIPHDNDRRPLDKVINSVTDTVFGRLVARAYLSSKPSTGYYDNYYAKVTAYVRMISPWATDVDPTATALTFAPIADESGESVFRYFDSASSRAGTADLNARLEGPIAIVGLGGTGGYVLDFVSKTPAAPIHIWDADAFLAHNAFRAPGAASAEQLRERPSKVAYFAEQYGAMRTGIVVHDEMLTSVNASRELQGMRFVFLCMDAGPAKRDIVATLFEQGLPFVDCGMAVARQQGKLAGIIRATAGMPGLQADFDQWVSYSSADDADEYGDNIQVVELNAMNAVLAIVAWKRWAGFYADRDSPIHSTYSIVGGNVSNSGPGLEDE